MPSTDGHPDIALSQVTLLPPITDPDKIICASRNYRAHAAEAGGPPPENPQVFLRLVNTLVAHNQPMVCPRMSGDFDYEGELAVIIGKPGRHIAKSDALSHVFGYTCFNDGSIRDIQFKHSIAAGKNFHATGGFGPWIVTADEIPHPTRLIEDSQGVTAIEYALIAAMIIVVAIAILGSVGTNLSTTFSTVAAAL
jgi:2-keto-4-pentenoate hydratase/2-oxohepta-3-ene-1,7-dioic acid hydratase in catechol pathway